MTSHAQINETFTLEIVSSARVLAEWIGVVFLCVVLCCVVWMCVYVL